MILAGVRELVREEVRAVREEERGAATGDEYITRKRLPPGHDPANPRDNKRFREALRRLGIGRKIDGHRWSCGVAEYHDALAARGRRPRKKKEPTPDVATATARIDRMLSREGFRASVRKTGTTHAEPEGQRPTRKTG